jgi:sugar phosphate permease
LPAGLSKFLGGMLGAAFSPRLMLACGLMATSVINIAFGFSTGVFWWTCLWALNGGLQVRKELRAGSVKRAERLTAGCDG